MNNAVLALAPALALATLAGTFVPMDLPAPIRQEYFNDDGSCVQCSVGMCGRTQGVPAAASLLEDSRFGPAERGGSGPNRVARYCAERNIRVYNITGQPTFDWMKWAMRTGRPAAIGAARGHFQTLVDYNPDTGIWSVCDNQTPSEIDTYTEREFRSLHLASGRWCVILDYPPHPPEPQYIEWWK